MECRTMCRCQRMDLAAETRVVRPSVKQIAPKISMATELVDLLAIHSCNTYRPRINRVPDKTISKRADTLFIKVSNWKLVQSHSSLTRICFTLLFQLASPIPCDAKPMRHSSFVRLPSHCGHLHRRKPRFSRSISARYMGVPSCGHRTLGTLSI